MSEREPNYNPDEDDEDLPATWRRSIAYAMSKRGESWADVESCTLTDAELDVEFDDGWGGCDGKPFTLWTAARVYFPAEYDGSEWVASVARHPDGKPTRHVGGPGA